MIDHHDTPGNLEGVAFADIRATHAATCTVVTKYLVEQDVSIPEKVATAVIEFVYTTLAVGPRRVGRPLRFELEGLHSARRGDYRIIYGIDDRHATVVIDTVAHRSDIYRRR